MSELFSRHGLFLCDLDDQGMPLLDGDDEFQNTYQHVSLLVGQDHDLGTGTLHTSVRCGRARAGFCYISSYGACFPYLWTGRYLYHTL